MSGQEERDKKPSPKRKAKRAVITGAAVGEPFILGDVYPNPFYAIATIPFTLLQGGWVRLELYSRAGVLVHTLVDRQMEAGEYKVFVKKDVAGLAAGRYYYHLRVSNADGSREERKALQIM